MKIPKLLVLGTLVLVMCLTGESLADRNPVLCSANNLFLNLTKSTTTVKNGQEINYTVAVGNQNGTGCFVDNATVTIQLPAADGTPTGTIVTIDTGASFPVDGSGNTTYPPVTYTVAVNPGVVDVVAKATASGTLHDAPTNHTAEIIKTVGTTVIWPNTLVGITATPNSGMFPITTDLVVTEQNTGDDPLTAVSVSVYKDDGGGPVLVTTLTAPPNSGDDGDGILEPGAPGETWTWNSGALLDIVLNKDTTFTAIGTGLDSEGEAVTFPTYPSEKAVASVDGDYPPPCIDVTKTVSCDEAVVGATVTYHYCIKNCSTLDMELTKIADDVVTDAVVAAAFHAVHAADVLTPSEEVCFDVPYVIKVTDADPLINTVRVDAKDTSFQQETYDEATATVDILTPCLTLEKSCTSQAPVEKGGVAFFKITLTNCGDLDLLVNVDDLDDPDCDTLGVSLPQGGAPWTCDLSIDIPADYSGTEFINHVTASWAVDTTNPCLAKNDIAPPAQAPCEVMGGATRTPGFWKTHTDFTSHVLTAHCVVLDLGFVQLDTIDEVCAYFWANKANNSDGSKRTKLCQARMHAAFQAIAALLNNCVPSGGGIPVDPAEIASILGGTDIDAIRELAGILGAYNESGDDVALIDPDGPPGSATPQECKAYDQSIADCLGGAVTGNGKGPK